MRLIRVNKDGEVFLLVSKHSLEKQDIAEIVDHVDIHYTLGTDRAVKALEDQGLQEVGHLRFAALKRFEKAVAVLNL